MPRRPGGGRPTVRDEPLLRLQRDRQELRPGAGAGRRRSRRSRRQVTALVGDNGAGKSVLIKCIAGHPRARRRPDLWEGKPVTSARRATPPRSGSRPSTRISRCATTSTSSRTCSSAASGVAHLPLDEERMETAAARDAAQPRRDHRALDPPAGRVAVGRPAPVGRDRQGGAVELQARDHGRADRRARRRADRRWCSTWSRRLADRGLAVLIVSHNMNDVFEVADRIAVLRPRPHGRGATRGRDRHADRRRPHDHRRLDREPAPDRR